MHIEENGEEDDVAGASSHSADVFPKSPGALAIAPFMLIQLLR